jgi:hypothetical protein
VGLIGQIDDVFRGQTRADPAQDGEPAQAGIEDAEDRLESVGGADVHLG